MTLLAAYNFDEASGAVLDVTGNGHDFSIDASITRQTGHTNTGLRHESTAADSLGPAIFGQTASRTLMAWVKRTSNAVDGWILEMKNGTANTGVWGFLYSGSSVQARAKNASNAATFVSVTQPSVNVWHHLAMTYDGTTIRFYIDGTSVGTPAAFAGPVWASATTFPFFDTVGAETVIDDVRVYDVALTQPQIATDMATPVSAGSAFSGNVALSGAGTLTNAGTPGHKGTVALSGSGSLAGTGNPGVTGSAALAGAGQLAGAGSPAVAGALGLSGAGTASDTGNPAVSGATALAGAGTLTETGAPAASGAAALSGTGSIASAGQPMLPGNLSLAGGGTLTGSAGNDYSGAAGLAGSGLLDLNGHAAIPGNLNLTGAGSLAAVGAPAHAGGLHLSGGGQLVGASSSGPPVEPTLTVTNSHSSDLTAWNQPSSQLEASHGV